MTSPDATCLCAQTTRNLFLTIPCALGTLLSLAATIVCFLFPRCARFAIVHIKVRCCYRGPHNGVWMPAAVLGLQLPVTNPSVG